MLGERPRGNNKPVLDPSAPTSSVYSRIGKLIYNYIPVSSQNAIACISTHAQSLQEIVNSDVFEEAREFSADESKTLSETDKSDTSVMPSELKESENNENPQDFKPTKPHSDLDTYNCFKEALRHHSLLKNPTYTVVIFGALKSGKSTLINAMSCMPRFPKFEDAVEAVLEPLLPIANDDFVVVEALDCEDHHPRHETSFSTMNNEYVIDYGSFSVKFIEMPSFNDKRGLDYNTKMCNKIMNQLCSQSKIHSFIFVIKDSESDSVLKNTLQSQLRLLPRSALSNCSFMYTTSSETSNAHTSSKQVIEAIFNRFHLLNGSPAMQLTSNNQFDIDNGPMLVLQSKKPLKGEILEACKTSWSLTHLNVKKFMISLPSMIPIRQNELLLVPKVEKLGAILLKYRNPQLSNVIRRLMASVADFGLNGTAIQCRDVCGAAVPLGIDEWGSVASMFVDHNDELAKLIEEIDQLLH